MPLVFGRSILGFGVVAGPPAPTWTDPDLNNASYDSVSFSIATQETVPNNIAFNNDGTSMYIIGTATDAIYQYTLSTAWDLSTASYASKSFSTGDDNTPRDFTFNNDGTKIYYVGSTSDTVYQYSLGTAYDISTASTDTKSLSVASQAGTPTGVELKSDGTKLYISDGGTDAIYQYSLSTAFDVSTGSYDSVSFSFSSQGTNTQSIFFSPDGTSLFVCDTTASNDTVYKYSLSTAWDVSTLSYANESFSLAGQDDPFGVAFKSDGSKMYMVGVTSDAVYQYSTVAPAWTNPDIATASYDSVSFSVATQDTFLHDLAFKNDGTKMYIMGGGNDSIFQYSLSTAWDASTASYDSVSFSVNSEEGVPTSLFFKPDGSKFYIAGSGQDTVFQYSMSTSWDVSTASYESKSFSVTTQENNPRDVAFKTDGTKMYILGVTNDRIDEYSLSTAWDVSTASHTTNFSIASQETGPQSLFFNPDGDKVWIVGSGNNTAFQYSLSTAWDISTASYDSVSFSVSSQMTGASGIEFKSDGSKMYVSDIVNDVVYQYSTVASAWTDPDLANASYDSITLPSTGTLQGETNAYGLTFKDDGTEVYYCGVSFDQIASYTLSTAWDLSTATYNTAYNVGSNPRDIHFSSDGTKMFTFHTAGNLIRRHDLTTGWDISTASLNSNGYTPTVNGQIRGGFLNSDGTRMWITDLGNFRSYNLSTGFDLSTASVDATATSRTSEYGGGLHFNPDGTKIFAIFANIIRSFSLSTAYDISTASEDSDFFSTTAQDGLMNGVAFKSDGSKAYTIGLNNDKIYQYST